ncbi:MAG: hypothetical protein ACQGVK_18525 [Myxococcota bacterium]
MEFPDGRRFAFTILDDTDDSTLENVRPVYARLAELGMRTTKTVWPVDCPEGSRNYFAADTLARPEYLAWVKELIAAGFELGSHGATMEGSLRERTEQGLALLEREFGHLPRLFVNHGENTENLYWGIERFHSWLGRGVARRIGGHRAGAFCGEDERSPYFWGDLCRRHIEYVRNFTFSTLDALEVNPEMPYSLESTPYVRFWFSTTDAPDVDEFKARLTPAAIDRLEARGGVCIVSTHLGKGFTRDGRLDPEVDAILVDLAGRNGWFVPVSTVLDHLRDRGAGQAPSRAALWRLELRYLADQVARRWQARRR